MTQALYVSTYPDSSNWLLQNIVERKELTFSPTIYCPQRGSNCKFERGTTNMVVKYPDNENVIVQYRGRSQRAGGCMVVGSAGVCIILSL